jgi:hypothetical protein
LNERDKKLIKSNIARGFSYREKYEINPKKCLHCNDEIEYEKRRNKFCSHSCAGSFNNVGVARNGTKREYKQCLVCGDDTYNLKFCGNNLFFNGCQKLIERS